MTTGGKTRRAYRCRHCGETDTIAENQKVWQTISISPAGPTHDDGCVYGEEDETTPLEDGEIDYECQSCGETAYELAELVEIVEVSDDDEEDEVE